MRVTHRFHPLYGREYEFVVHRQNWGEDRVYYYDEQGELCSENGKLFSVLTGWTDAAPVDPFVVVADGRCPFTTAGLLALADLIDRLRSQPDRDRVVREITP